MSCMIFLAQLAAGRANAEPPRCGSGPNVWLRVAADSGAAIARPLAAGLAGSGIAVCLRDTSSGSRVASVDLERAPDEPSTWRIVVSDAMTRKLLERTVALGAMPEDSRAVALALYVEELLQASWAELALEDRVYLQEHPVAAPPAVRAEVARVLQEPRAARREATSWFRVSLAGMLAVSQGRLVQAAGQLGFAVRALRWFEPGLRIGYGTCPAVDAPHGSIGASFASAGVNLELLVPLSPLFDLRLPQAIDVLHVTFTGHADPDSDGYREVRGAVSVTHGLGARVLLGAGIGVSALAGFSWMWLPAEATDGSHTEAGISGFGGKAELAIDAAF
ncbi:MAG TPA: hypothetical protein VJV78_39755 [Polyangiales bacterium]|nr:hypothetical protein [Polyangiales bacterium]